MYDFDNDQLEVFEEDFLEYWEEDLGFEKEDETLSTLAALFDDEFTALAELIEQEDKEKLNEFFNNFYSVFITACDDEFNIDGSSYFELLLTDNDLPSILEILGEV